MANINLDISDILLLRDIIPLLIQTEFLMESISKKHLYITIKMTPWGSYEDQQMNEYIEELLKKNAHKYTDDKIWERNQKRKKELEVLEDHGVITHKQYLEQIHRMPLHPRSLLYALIKEVAEEAWNEVWLEEDPLNIEEDLLDGLFEEEK